MLESSEKFALQKRYQGEYRRHAVRQCLLQTVTGQAATVCNGQKRISIASWRRVSQEWIAFWVPERSQRALAAMPAFQHVRYLPYPA